ncbi:MAG TPA: DUF3597 domain-containing protein [Steroidobacteraceae bacterium]|nr:DUF3597 domain-containing protein [Steroidobacteraceae bacterium]
MSIFSRIKDAIFGHASASPAQPARPANQPPRPSATPASAGAPASPANAKWDRPAEPAQQVDVDQVLSGLAAKNSQKLNWQTSIVDLMKLLGIDSSLENRKELARELGFTGDTSDSASMNVWLHKRVMQELEKNGGKVPATLVA